MKIRKLSAATVMFVMMFTSAAWSAQPEDALSVRNEDSLYTVIRLEDTARLADWICSEENLKLFMPLILKGQSGDQIAMASGLVRAVVSVLPIRSAAVVMGINSADVKKNLVFGQLAFTVKPELSDLVAKVEAGTATAGDIAMLLAGEKTAAAFLEMMIKVEREDNNILRVDGDNFMTAKNGVVILASSMNEALASLKALEDSETRLFAAKPRKFSEKDFALLHVDYETAAELDDEGELDDLDARKYFAKPLEVEFAFKRLPEKFLMSAAVNLKESLKKEYAEKLIKQSEESKPVKGGNIDLASVGGTASPIAAVGTRLDFENLKDNDAWSPVIKSILRNLRVRFGVSEAEAMDLFSGPVSMVVNDTVTFEGFKLPAVYFSQTGKSGAAQKVFAKLTKSQHFQKVHEGILQLDSSISPVSCLAADRGESLGLYFAELSSLEKKPELKPGLSELMERESVAAIWLDFAGLQNWLTDDDNSVLVALGPLMTFAGYGQYFRALREILTAELSVPAVSFWGENSEVFHTEFAVKEINAENGLFARSIKLYNEFNAKKTDKTDKKEKTE